MSASKFWNPQTKRSYFWTGALEVCLSDLEYLDDITNSFMKFQLEELRKKNIKNFRARRMEDNENGNR